MMIGQETEYGTSLRRDHEEHYSLTNKLSAFFSDSALQRKPRSSNSRKREFPLHSRTSQSQATFFFPESAALPRLTTVAQSPLSFFFAYTGSNTLRCEFKSRLIRRPSRPGT
jgi:hypothetical protein